MHKFIAQNTSFILFSVIEYHNLFVYLSNKFVLGANLINILGMKHSFDKCSILKHLNFWSHLHYPCGPSAPQPPAPLQCKLMRFNRLWFKFCLESFSNRRLIDIFDPNKAPGFTFCDDTIQIWTWILIPNLN